MDPSLSLHERFRRAVVAAGGQSKFARMVGCTPGNIWQLLQKGSPLPGRYVLKAEGTGISRYDLRPDLHPRDSSSVLPVLPPISTIDEAAR